MYYKSGTYEACKFQISPNAHLKRSGLGVGNAELARVDLGDIDCFCLLATNQLIPNSRFTTFPFGHSIVLFAIAVKPSLWITSAIFG